MGLQSSVKLAAGYIGSGASWAEHQCGLRHFAVLAVTCRTYVMSCSSLMLVSGLDALGTGCYASWDWPPVLPWLGLFGWSYSGKGQPPFVPVLGPYEI